MASISFQGNNYNVAGVIPINTDLMVLDCADAGYVSIQCTSMGTTGVVTPQWSNDINFTATPTGATLTTPSGGSAATITAAGLWTTQVVARYLRLRMTTATTAGTTTFLVARFANPVNNGVVLNPGPNMTVVGSVAHDAAISGNPVRIAGRAMTANYTAVTSGDAADLVCTTVGAAVQKPYSIPELDWQAAITITNTTSTAVRAAAGAGIRNYCTGIQYQNSSATATLFTILDGATIIANFSAPASMAVPATIVFLTPLRTTANTALNAQAATTAANLFINAQGYAAP